jgi:hypothetical protein
MSNKLGENYKIVCHKLDMRFINGVNFGSFQNITLEICYKLNKIIVFKKGEIIYQLKFKYHELRPICEIEDYYELILQI